MLFSLVILTSRFERKRGLFGNRLLTFEERSVAKDDTWVCTLLSRLPHPTSERTVDPPTYDLACNRPTYMAGQWNLVLKLELSCPSSGDLTTKSRRLSACCIVEVSKKVGSEHCRWFSS
ncbi:hypothetical protein AVEN_20478-1 [Araneus ventricosus]|uniref:Uncharacterized protein n=1 Tax=Araneus ventricosus TaxID=182803 RepID=A0A4Y2KPX5_ARAVE|nr:hypothetical protein AVEN_20478-1 [Araneus ventricosus]